MKYREPLADLVTFLFALAATFALVILLHTLTPDGRVEQCYEYSEQGQVRC